MILQKRFVFVAACLLNCSLFSQTIFADGFDASSPPQTSYYSPSFLEDVRHGVKDQDLKKSILGTFKKHVSIGYDSAKVFLMGKFYLINDNNHYAVKDVYCGREIDENEFPNGKPAPNKVPDNNIINTEHTWPQSRFNGNLEKGMQKADLHHLFPTDSKINNIRGNFKFGEVQKDLNILKCNGPRIGIPNYSSERVFEPPQDHKGNVARALFYFSIKYKLAIDPNEEAVLRKWSSEDPVDQEEMVRNDEIEKVQHSRNPFIDFPQLSDNISDF
jgi:deoxyribonuclease I